jgi:hypothetical protein
MTVGMKWGFLYTKHGEKPKKCDVIDYIPYNVNTSIVVLLNLRFYSDRLEIDDHPAKSFPKMIKYLYRTRAHIFFYHRKLFNTLKEKLKIC